MKQKLVNSSGVMKTFKVVTFLFLVLEFSSQANAFNFGRAMSGAGVVARGMQEAENRALQNRLIELQLQEANRMAIIQQLEYQRRIRELNEAQQRELQRQQQINVEALRREQARISEIKAVEKDNKANLDGVVNAKIPPKNLAQQLTEVALLFRGHSPQKLNNEISFIGASSRDESLFIMIKFDSLDTKIDPYKKVNDALQKQIEGAVVATCLNQSLEPLARQGAVIRYSFFDANQVFILGVDTGVADCKDLHGLK
jgi:hypothetical protein